jgi:Arc/MetJ-type ribon-helix-helix transcriptional regulator
MTSITVDIPDVMKEFLEQQVRAGRYKNNSTFVQMLIAEAARNQWRQEADEKLRESLQEYERGQGVLWQNGDCEKMVREYLKQTSNGKLKKT